MSSRPILLATGGLKLRTGITKLWQVSGRSDITDFEEVVQLDAEYIDNWSLWLGLPYPLEDR